MTTAVRSVFQGEKFNLRPWVLCLFLLIGLSAETKAEDGVTDEGNPSGLVEVRSNDEAYLPYLERRQTHGWQLGFGMENYQPKDFISNIDANNTYQAMYGKADIPVYYIETGYKLNLPVVSLSALLGYGHGQIKDTKTGETNSLVLERTSLKLMMIFDGIMNEPYVAPYAALSVWEIGFDEKITEADLSHSARTKMGNTMTAGLLFQLNWLEQQSSRWAWLNSGLENTYLDVFMSKYGKSNGEDDPDTTSDFNWGAGLRIEF